MDWYHRLYEGREALTNPEEERAYREMQRDLTRPEVEALGRLLNLAPGARILDAYCGNGRHSLGLAQYGFEVAGVDLSFSRIRFAHHWARDEKARATFVVGNVCSLPFQQAFAAVLILGGSFTHFPEEDRNVALLEGFGTLLHPGGLLLIDNPNPLRFWRIQHPEGTIAEQEALPYFDMPLGRGEIFGYVRYYGAQEIQRLFQNANFKVRRILGSREGEPYTTHSPRMILIGQPAGLQRDLEVERCRSPSTWRG